MPLNRDQKDNDEKSLSLADYAVGKQHSRSTRVLKLADRGRPISPLDGADERSQSITRRGPGDGRGANVSKKFTLDEPGIENRDTPTIYNMKIPVPNTMHGRKASDPRQQQPLLKHERPQIKQPRHKLSNNNVAKAQEHHGNAFDETQSLDQSTFGDLAFEENQTAVFHPQEQPSFDGKEETHDPYVTGYDQDHTRLESNAQAFDETMGLPHDWREQVADERQYWTAKTGYVPNPKQDGLKEHLVSIQHQVLRRQSVDSLEPPETPSRAQSVPQLQQSNVHAPVPRKGVNFTSNPEVFDDPPGVASPGMARDDSHEQSTSRPSSVQPLSGSSLFRSKPLQTQPNASNRLRHSQFPPAHQSARFQKVEDHRDDMVQQEPKVSAPGSDVQGSSDDEGTRAQAERSKPSPARSGTIQSTSRKRLLGDSTVLDYSTEALSEKRLADLQQEPYTQDPGDPPRNPARDNHGNEMTLQQILQNLSKITSEQQRETFRVQTDEEWAKTGQWFVARFQADLRRLSEVRVKRRKIALRYEDQIRRRQRSVEHQQAEVEKELKGLQEGGTGLLKDRKLGGGSRSSTPMKHR